MKKDAYKPDMTINVDKQLIEGKVWQVITVEYDGAAWVWDDMPVHVRESYLKARYFVEKFGGKFSYTVIPNQGAKAALMIPYKFAFSAEEIKKLITRWAKNRSSQ